MKLKDKIKVSALLATWLTVSISHAYGSDFSNLKMALFISVVLERMQAQAYLNNHPRGSIKTQQSNGAFSTGE
jgi:hypothetical protein